MSADDLSNSESPPPVESSNRTFRAAAGILGGIILLSVACLVVYGLFLLPSQRAGLHRAVTTQVAMVPQAARAITAAAAVLGIATSTAAPLPTQAPSLAPPGPADSAATFRTPTATAVAPTRTPFIVRPTAGKTSQAAPFTATVAAALTQASFVQITSLPTSTALPATGIAAEYGLPRLGLVALLLLAVSFLSRRLRAAHVK